MIIVIETAIIIAYMMNSILGMALMLVYSVGKLFFIKQGDSIIRIFELMIMSLPMAYIGIIGPSMHQLFSWYNFFLVIFLIKILRRFSTKLPMTKSAMLSVMILMICMFTNLIWAHDLGESLAEIAQIFVMIIPIMIVHLLRNRFPISNDSVYQLICLYVDVCVGTAIAMLMQYVFYYYLQRQIGLIHFSGGNRVQFYGLFRGASILPIFIGVGMVFLFIECFEKKVTVVRLAKIGIIFLASMLNTSRTALFTLMIVLFCICLKYLIKRPSFRGFFIIILGFSGFYYAIDYITTLRNKLTGFLDANGRNVTWDNGIRIWGTNLKNILLGEGFSGGRWEGITKPHNLVIQSLSQCGIIVTFLVMAMLVKYVYDNRKSPYIYLPLFILLSGMLVTDFYANAFTTVIFMIVDLYRIRNRTEEYV